MLRYVRAAVTTACVLVVAGSATFSTPAGAMSSTECSEKYQQAKSENKLNGMKWAEFRKTQCAGSASSAQTPAQAPAPVTSAATGIAKFPSVVDPKYAKEAAGRARMHTCRDQYQANKVSSANGGLHWIQKGGGYYSECNKHLKS